MLARIITDDFHNWDESRLRYLTREREQDSIPERLVTLGENWMYVVKVLLNMINYYLGSLRA